MSGLAWLTALAGLVWLGLLLPAELSEGWKLVPRGGKLVPLAGGTLVP